MSDESEARAAAREKARLNRRRQRRRASGGRWLIRGGIVVVLAAAVIAVVLVLRGGRAPSGPSPANMAGDGITLGAGLVAERTADSPAAPPETAGSGSATATSTATSTPAPSAETVRIAVYVDYLSPGSAAFSEADGDYVRDLVRSGAATVTYHPVVLTTSPAEGTRYSQRAAATAACVATYSPDSFFDFDRRLLARQPAAGETGPTNAQLVALVRGVPGIQGSDRLARCITDQDYATWATDATARAGDGPIPGSSVSRVTSAPTILVDGHRYRYSTPFTAAEFSSFVVTAAGNRYTGSATPAPTASGSPVPGRSKVGTPAR
jgi:protein-disulfide isomerase